ncbi:MAG: hypothetical protein OXH95_06195 [bacterium]|nr:hypothetical protein [bacterium]
MVPRFAFLVVIAIILLTACFSSATDPLPTTSRPRPTITTTTHPEPTTTTTDRTTTTTTRPTTTTVAAVTTVGTVATSTTSTVATTLPPTTTVPANPGDAVSCVDFDTWEAAQTWFDTYSPHYGDIAYLDTNENGVACEKLLPEGVTAANVATTTTTRLTTTTTAQPATTTTTRPTTTTTRRTTTTTRAPARSPFTYDEMEFINSSLFWLVDSGGGFYRNGIDNTGDGRVDMAWDDPAARTIINGAREVIRDAQTICETIYSVMAETGFTTEEALLFGYNTGAITEAAYLYGLLVVAYIC